MSKRVSAAVLGLCVAVAPAFAFADQPRPGEPGIHVGPGVSNVAQCAAGFTADPANIQGSNPYNQSYTCTGPAIVCSPSFKAQDSVAGTIPPAQGQLLGQTIYGSPVTIKGGRMVYTCAEPNPPPQ